MCLHISVTSLCAPLFWTHLPRRARFTFSTLFPSFSHPLFTFFFTLLAAGRMSRATTSLTSTLRSSRSPLVCSLVYFFFSTALSQGLCVVFRWADLKHAVSLTKPRLSMSPSSRPFFFPRKWKAFFVLKIKISPWKRRACLLAGPTRRSYAHTHTHTHTRTHTHTWSNTWSNT